MGETSAKVQKLTEKKEKHCKKIIVLQQKSGLRTQNSVLFLSVGIAK